MPGRAFIKQSSSSECYSILDGNDLTLTKEWDRNVLKDIMLCMQAS